MLCQVHRLSLVCLSYFPHSNKHMETFVLLHFVCSDMCALELRRFSEILFSEIFPSKCSYSEEINERQ